MAKWVGTPRLVGEARSIDDEIFIEIEMMWVLPETK
jgi:hypothetical protein